MPERYLTTANYAIDHARRLAGQEGAGMIRVLKSGESGLESIDRYEPGCWIEVTAPDMDEVRRLSDELAIPLDFLTDPLDINERARVEVEDGVTLIVLRIPRHEPESDIPYTTLPLGIVFKDDMLVTVCSRETDILRYFSSRQAPRGFSTARRTRLLLQIFLRTALTYLAYLKDINNRTSEVEKRLHIAMKNEELIRLLNLEKCLVYFTTSLRSNEIMMNKLEKVNTLDLDVDDMDFLEDVLIENKQAIEMSTIYSNILSGMMDAFASVISNNLNVVMKFLTAVTIILMIPTLVASIYGMNVSLPFQDSRHAFLITMLISVILSAIGVVIFRYRKLF